MCPCAQITDQKVHYELPSIAFQSTNMQRKAGLYEFVEMLAKTSRLVTVVCDFKLPASFVCNQFVQVYKVI